MTDACGGVHMLDVRSEPEMQAGAVTLTHLMALRSVVGFASSPVGREPPLTYLRNSPLPPGAMSTSRRDRVFETLLTTLTIAATDDREED